MQIISETCSCLYTRRRSPRLLQAAQAGQSSFPTSHCSCAHSAIQAVLHLITIFDDFSCPHFPVEVPNEILSQASGYRRALTCTFGGFWQHVVDAVILFKTKRFY